MNRRTEEWRELISQGESETLEFRSGMTPDDAVVRDLNAFANTAGGTIIFGVNDRGQINGLSQKEVSEIIVRLDGLEAALSTLSCDSASFDLDGNHLAYISVSRAAEHLLPVKSPAGVVYTRRGALTVRAGEAPESEPVSAAVAPAARPVTAFVAMSFRSKGARSRRSKAESKAESALDDYFEAMKRAAKNTGLPITVMRADMTHGHFEISQKVLNDIDRADLVIADLTLSSHNVYFELGYAMGRRKRVIQTALDDTNPEFDVRNWNTIFYENATDLEKKLAPALEAAYAEVLKGS